MLCILEEKKRYFEETWKSWFNMFISASLFSSLLQSTLGLGRKVARDLSNVQSTPSESLSFISIFIFSDIQMYMWVGLSTLSSINKKKYKCIFTLSLFTLSSSISCDYYTYHGNVSSLSILCKYFDFYLWNWIKYVKYGDIFDYE